ECQHGETGEQWRGAAGLTGHGRELVGSRMTRERITRLFWQVPHRAQAATAGRKTQRSKAHRTFVRVATRGAPPRIRCVFRFYCRCVLLGLGPCLYGTEQAWFTRAWLTTDGLPNNHVTAVAENADGE